MKLDIGSGADKLEGYNSVDLYAEADFKDDIRTLAGFRDDSIDEVRTFHLLEHLKDIDIFPAMRAVFRILKPGAFWRIEVPDLVWLFQDFLNTPEEGRWGWKLQTIFGLQSHEGEYHRTGFSAERLVNMLKECGFVKLEVSNEFSDKYNQKVIDVKAYKPHG